MTQSKFDLFEWQSIAHFTRNHAATAIHGHILILRGPGYRKSKYHALLADTGGSIPQRFHLDEAAVPCLAGIGIFGVRARNLVMEVRHAMSSGIGSGGNGCPVGRCDGRQWTKAIIREKAVVDDLFHIRQIAVLDHIKHKFGLRAVKSDNGNLLAELRHACFLLPQIRFREKSVSLFAACGML